MLLKNFPATYKTFFKNPCVTSKNSRNDLSILDEILPKYSDFRRYSANIAILDVIPHKKMILDITQPKCDCFRRYSSHIQCFYMLFYQNAVILDVIPTNIAILDVVPISGMKYGCKKFDWISWIRIFRFRKFCQLFSSKNIKFFNSFEKLQQKSSQKL